MIDMVSHSTLHLIVGFQSTVSDDETRIHYATHKLRISGEARKVRQQNHSEATTPELKP